eukprot:Em0006g1369a
MGTPPPEGHIVPGVLFIIYGVYWSFFSIWSHLTRGRAKAPHPSVTYSNKLPSCQEYGRNVMRGPALSFALYKQERREHEVSQRSWIPQPFCTSVPLEPIVKVFCSVVGIVTECVDIVTDPATSRTSLKLYTVTNPDGSVNDLSQVQHITMYSAFALSGLVDLLTLCIRCPDHTSQVFLALAFLVEAILFHSHMGGMTPLSTQLHVTLTIISYLCFLFALLRVWFPTCYLVNMGLSLTMTLQGTWFIQVVDILYVGRYLWLGVGNTEQMELHEHGQVTMATTTMHGMGNTSVGPHNGGDHNGIMFASALLTWHLIAVVLFALVEWVVVSRVYGCWRRRRSRAVKLVADVEGGGDQVGEEEKLMEDVTVMRDADL